MQTRRSALKTRLNNLPNNMLRIITREMQAQRARSAVRANFASVRTWVRETVERMETSAIEWDAYRPARTRTRHFKCKDARFELEGELHYSNRAIVRRPFHVRFSMQIKGYPNTVRVFLRMRDVVTLKRVLRRIESRLAEIAATFQMTRSGSNPVWNTQLLRQNTIAAHPTMYIEDTTSDRLQALLRSMNWNDRTAALNWQVWSHCHTANAGNLRKVRWATDALTRMMLR
jgi:hypothetical protein